ncbi:uncharacterized protein LOC112585250 [Bubalus bubalis]|uniref:uncharacterized protein LOC112585250 n=1 Tax=Bubalus bubalis TaxID=89462 RepID=UPI001D1077CA|nr:uncharacterized protein LOC112585250 [Bubalus bubalis]
MGSAGAYEAVLPRERTPYPASGPGPPRGRTVPVHGSCVHPSLGGRSGGRPDPAHNLGPSSGGRPLARLARRRRVHRTRVHRPRVHRLFAPGDVHKPVPRLFVVPLSPPKSLVPVLSPTSQTQPEEKQQVLLPLLLTLRLPRLPPLRLGLEGRQPRCLWKLHLALLQNKFISVSRSGVFPAVSTHKDVTAIGDSGPPNVNI